MLIFKYPILTVILCYYHNLISHKILKYVLCIDCVNVCVLQKRFGSFNNNGLMNAVYSLKKQCKLNLPKMYEIESKVFIVLSKLEKITTILDYNNLEIGEKIDELYKIILKEKESHLLPYVIQRMNTLKIFCQKGKIKVILLVLKKL